MPAGEKVVGIIQARMASTRLPGKILAPIVGQRPLLVVLLERVRSAQLVDEWWVATSDRPVDALTGAWAEAMGVRTFRGDEEDVLARFTGVITASQADWIVRLTADDPFVDGGIVDVLVEQRVRLGDSGVTLGEVSRKTPLGYCPQLARAVDVVHAAAELEMGHYHRSHVLSVFAERGKLVALELPPTWPERPTWRWTVDTPADLQMAQHAFARFGNDWATSLYPAMVSALDDAPEVVAMNQQVQQKTLEEG